MNVWTLSHGQDGYQVRIATVPLWRVVVEESYGSALHLLGHPCCWSLKWIPTEWLRDRASLAQFRLLNNPVSFAASGRHEKSVDTFDITDERAGRISPDFAADMAEIFAEDEPLRPFWSSMTTATGATFTAAPSSTTWTGLS